MLCSRWIEATFENSQWRKAIQMQSVWLRIYSFKQSDKTHEKACLTLIRSTINLFNATINENVLPPKKTWLMWNLIGHISRWWDYILVWIQAVFSGQFDPNLEFRYFSIFRMLGQVDHISVCSYFYLRRQSGGRAIAPAPPCTTS